MKQPSQLTLKSLEKAIYDLHGCRANWIESVQVKEVFGGQVVWEGKVWPI